MKAYSMTELKDTIRWAFSAKEPLFILGPPGIGKSQAVFQVAKEMGFQGVIDFRVATLDAGELAFPEVKEEQTYWRILNILPKTGKWVLFFDELNLGQLMVQKMCYQLIQDRCLTIANYKLPPETVVVAAGNREEDKCGVIPMPRALEGRFLHVEFLGPTVEEWYEWGLEHGIHPHILSFLKLFRRELLFKWDANSQEKAQPTPRTWEKASHIYEKTLRPETVALAVGDGAAFEFKAWVEMTKRIDFNEFIKNPHTAEIPEEPSAQIALAGALTNAVLQNPTSVPYISALGILAFRMSEELGYYLVHSVFTNTKTRNILIKMPIWTKIAEKWLPFLLPDGR